VSSAIAGLAADLLGRAEGRRRLMVAIAGPPGSGKSVLSAALAAALDRLRPGAASVMPMDGYHYDNAVLEPRGLLARKGAPETFDVDGFAGDLGRIRRAERDVAVPVFDRGLDLARAGARIIPRDLPIVLVEGNYLLLRNPGWCELKPLFDRTLMLEVAEAELERRLVRRWLAYGLAPDAARARALGNDIPNARRVIADSAPADVLWPNEEALAGLADEA
jgi:pantothenate kinase